MERMTGIEPAGAQLATALPTLGHPQKRRPGAPGVYRSAYRPSNGLNPDDIGADEGARTLDNQLGKLELYQLSYIRMVCSLPPSSQPPTCTAPRA